MKKLLKKILIVDEAGFTRICSAILEKDGYGTSAVSDIEQFDSKSLNYNNFGLVIMSYPYGSFLLEELKKSRIPTLILSDQMNRELMMKLEHFDKSSSHCMIKPLDFNKFRNIVNQVMDRLD